MPAPGAHARAASFGSLGEVVYLDTATQGVPPASAAGVLRAEVDAWSRGEADLGRWEAAGQEARRLAARFLGAAETDVALVPNHVTAASTVARGLPHLAVAVPEAEYRSNLLPWLHGRDRVRLVPSPATTERLCAAVDTGVELVAVSAVQSADGVRVDLRELVDHAHRRGALVYVDASQSLGMDASLATCGADFVGAVAYKWLLGARGAAFLAVRPEHHARFASLLPAPQQATDVVDGKDYGSEYETWDDARRFDQPPGWLAWVATAAALSELAAYDVRAVDEHATGLARRFVDGAGLAPPVDLASPIVSLPRTDASATAEVLRARGVRAAVRAGSLRFAFHLYNTENDVEQALDALAAASTKE